MYAYRCLPQLLQQRILAAADTDVPQHRQRFHSHGHCFRRVFNRTDRAIHCLIHRRIWLSHRIWHRWSVIPVLGAFTFFLPVSEHTFQNDRSTALHTQFRPINKHLSLYNTCVGDSVTIQQAEGVYWDDTFANIYEFKRNMIFSIYMS